MTLYVSPDSPVPISTPQLSMSASGVVACAIVTSPSDVENGADHDDLRGAETVGDHAGEGLHDSPHEVLDGDRQREGLASPMEVRAHRLQEQTEPVAQPHRKREDDGAPRRGSRSACANRRGIRMEDTVSSFVEMPVSDRCRRGPDAAARRRRAWRSAHRASPGRSARRPAIARASSAAPRCGSPWHRQRVSDTSRVRASRPGVMATKPRSTSGSSVRDNAVRSRSSVRARSDIRAVPCVASVRSSENCVTRSPDGAIRSS